MLRPVRVSFAISEMLFASLLQPNPFTIKGFPFVPRTHIDGAMPRDLQQ